MFEVLLLESRIRELESPGTYSVLQSGILV